MNTIPSGRPLRHFLLGCLLFGSAAGPLGGAELRVYFDADDDPATGCPVDTSDGSFEGVDLRLHAEITPAPGGSEVSSLSTSSCVDPVAGLFGPRVAIEAPFAPPWPIGAGQGTGGSDVLEAYLPRTTVSDAWVVRLGLELFPSGASPPGISGDPASDALLSTDGTPDGPPILVALALVAIPVLSPIGLLLLCAGLLLVARRRLGRPSPGSGSALATVLLLFGATLVAGQVLAMVFVPDGTVGDWATVAPAAVDDDDDGATGAELLAAFVSVEDDVVAFRVDAVLNGPPQAVDDAYATDEDVPLSVGAASGVLSNDTDPNSDALSAVLVDDVPAASGTLTLDADGSFDYAPAAGVNGQVEFTYRATDGFLESAIATATIDVGEVNDPPTAVDDVGATVEDTPVVVDVLANDSDSDGALDPASVTVLAPGPASGSTLVDPGTGSITYTPDPNTNGVDSFDYRVCDLGKAGLPPACATATVAVTIDPVDDPPTITPIPDQVISEDGSTGPLAFTLDDVDTPIGALSLSPTPTSSNTLLVPNGNLTLGGAGASRTIQAAPAADQNDGNAGGPALVTVTVTDGTTPVTEVFQVSVTAVDDPPTITTIPDQVISEDGTTGPLAFTIGDVDTPIGTLALSPGPSSSNATLIPDANLTLGGAGANRTIEATPAADENDTSAGGPTTVTVSVTDGTTPVTEVFEISVTSVDDPPTITTIPDQVISEDGTTGPLAFTLDDVDTPIGSLALSPSPTSSNATLIPDANLTLGGAGANRTIEATPAADENDTSAGGPATVTVTVTDGTTPVAEVFQVSVTAVNDAPECTPGSGPAAFTEDGGPVTVDGSLLVTDADDTNLQSATVTISNLADVGQESLAAATGGTSIVAAYVAPTLSLSGVDTLANYQQVLRSVTYDNSDQDPDTTLRIVQCVVNDGSDPSPAAMLQVQVTGQNDPPMVTNATIDYTAIGNTLLRVDGPDADDHDLGLPGRVASTQDTTDALAAAGASDVDSPAPVFVPEVAETTDQGGSLTLDDDGDFHYTPPIGFTGIDTETLTITDGEGGNVPVTLRITVSDTIWYVEDTTGAKNPAGDADGRSTDAFETLGAAEAASGPGDTILVMETDAPLDEGISLQSGQKLYGQRVEEEPVSLLPAGLMLEEISDTNSRPQIHRGGGVTVTVDASAGTLADVEIRHLDLESGDTDVIEVLTSGTDLVTGLLIDENVLNSVGARGIDVNSAHTSGEASVTITDNRITSLTDGLDVDHTAAGDLVLEIDGNEDIDAGARGISVNATAGTLTVESLDGNSVSGDTGGDGMVFESVTFDADASTAAFEQVDADDTAIGSPGNAVGGSGLVLSLCDGDLLFDDLDVEAGGFGIHATGTGEANVGAGTGFRLTTGAGSSVVAIGGPALDLDPLTASMILASITSTNSADRGIRIHDVAGTLDIQGGSISGAAMAAVEVDQDTVTNALNLTYSGTIDNTSGPMILVDGYPAGTLTFDGASLSDSGAGADTGTGIQLEDVDGTVRITAFSTTLNQSDGHGIHVLGDSDGAIEVDDTTITSPALGAVRIFDGADQLGGTFTFDNVDVTQGTDNQLLLDVQGLSGGSVSFDATSALVATDGTGIRILSNAGTSPITLSGPVDLGTGASRLSDGPAFSMAGNSPGTTVAIPDLDVFTSGQTAVEASGAGTLDLDALSLDTASNGRALDLDGIVSNVDVDSATCSHSSDCIQLTSLGVGSLTTFAGVNLTCTGGSCFHANLARSIEVLGSGNQVESTRTALAIVDTAIGPNHVAFQRIDVDGGGASSVPALVLDDTGPGNFEVTGVATTDGTGGTIEDILADAVTLFDTDGSVTFRNMVYEDIGNMAGPSDTLSGHDAIHGEQVDGGLVLDNVTIRRISDMAVHGATLGGAAATTFDGLRIVNSTIEDTNRYHVANVGDDNNEGMVRIRGLIGTVDVLGSTLRRGAELLDLNSATSGTLALTVQGSTLRDSFKGLAASMSAAGLACLNVKMEGGADAVIHVGDPAEVDPGLGNVFEDCATVAVGIKHFDENATGDIDVVVSRNTMTVDLSFGGVGGNPFGFGNQPGTGILLRPQGTSAGTLDAIVSHNSLTRAGLAEGQIGAITVQLDSAGGVTSGTSQVRVSDNTITTPVAAPIFVLAERNTAARVFLDDNTIVPGVVSLPDFGPSSLPGNSTQVRTREDGQLDVTIQDHFFPAQDTAFVEVGESFKARTLGGASGADRLCLSLRCPAFPAPCSGAPHTTSDLGYQLRNDAGTLLLHQGASASAMPQTILQQNDVRGGGGNPNLNPPTVSVVGAVTATGTACAVPTGGIFP